MSNFSTLNESSLHNTLKKLYAFQTDGQTEVEKFSHVYDIITNSGEAIEIQNQNLRALLPKITDTLEKGIRITVVHPVVIQKTIELYDEDGKLLKKTKSPKKGCIYDIFNEIRGITPILLDKNFTLEVPEITITEIRKKEKNAVQSKNKKRRFKKDWNKTGKKLNEIGIKHVFKGSGDYLSLLPKSLPEEFCAKNLEKCLKEEKLAPARIYINSNLIIWVLKKMALLEQTKTERKSRYYTKSFNS